MADELVTILVPHYKTLELTKLCLRLLRKHTDPNKIKVIVIDNDSQDESVAYLRSLGWITLIERSAVPEEKVFEAHSRALDMGLAQVTTPYVLSIHTDTLIKKPDWLAFLLAPLERNENVAGVGAWKLERTNFFTKIGQYIAACYQSMVRTKKNNEPTDEKFYYLRSYCALYRTRELKKNNLFFSDGDGVAGKAIQKALLNAGREIIFIKPSQLSHYLAHLNHATMVLNPELGVDKKNLSRGYLRLKKRMAEFEVDKILADNSLDL